MGQRKATDFAVPGPQHSQEKGQCHFEGQVVVKNMAFFKDMMLTREWYDQGHFKAMTTVFMVMLLMLQ